MSDGYPLYGSSLSLVEIYRLMSRRSTQSGTLARYIRRAAGLYPVGLPPIRRPIASAVRCTWVISSGDAGASASGKVTATAASG